MHLCRKWHWKSRFTTKNGFAVPLKQLTSGVQQGSKAGPCNSLWGALYICWHSVLVSLCPPCQSPETSAKVHNALKSPPLLKYICNLSVCRFLLAHHINLWISGKARAHNGFVLPALMIMSSWRDHIVQPLSSGLFSSPSLCVHDYCHIYAWRISVCSRFNVLFWHVVQIY